MINTNSMFQYQPNGLYIPLHYWMDLKTEDDIELITELKALLYPQFPPGCHEQDFLAHFDPLIQFINRFDLTAYDLQDPELIEKIVFTIIRLLSNSLTQCPRRQLMISLLGVIGKCKGNLKNLAVGRQTIRYSKWQSLLKNINPINKLHSSKQASLRVVTDTLYLKHKRIPHLELLLSSHPGLLEAKEKFQATLSSEDSRLPQHHHHYIALIAAATLGCKYIWNRAAIAFLACGGDPKWLSEGVSAVPLAIQEISKLSGLLAYNMRGFVKNNSFRECKSGSGLDREYMLEALIVLSYYQCLSCFALASGLVTQNTVHQNYLPKSIIQGISHESFETVKECQNIQAEQEENQAEQMGTWFRLEPEEEKQLMQKFKTAKCMADRKAVGLKFVKKVENLKWYGSQPGEKILNLRSHEQLKRAFSKYVDFEPLEIAYQAPQIKSENQLVLASQWDLQLQGLKRLQSAMGWKVRGELSELIKHLKIMNGQAGRRITHYYQFYNSYIHQFVSYTKLLQQLSDTERGYLKLVTKSPFLFNQSNFEHMNSELKQKEVESLTFILQAVGCKLELAVNLATLQFDRAYEEGSDQQ